MLARQRQREILSRLQESGSVRVAELARRLHVTEETVRRDLEKLEAAGRLVRAHGGALLAELHEREVPYDVRKAANLPAKRAIAAAAAALVAEGDVIALDASTTALEFARALPDKAMTVITNSVAITSALGARARMKVFCTGGSLDSISMSLVGTVAEDALNRFHIGKVFFSCMGVDTTRGMSVAADEHARMKRRMIELAERAYLLVDHSKFGINSLVIFARFDELDGIVTDQRTDETMLRGIREGGVEIYRAAETRDGSRGRSRRPDGAIDKLD